MDLAERQLREGTASAQVITHYLKLGSTKEKIEQDILKEQQKLIKAKTESIEATKNLDDVYKQAIKAMKKYGGTEDSDEY